MIKGIIFDFDGTIMDSETPVYQAWSEIYRQYNQFLPVELWRRIVGTTGGNFDPAKYLSDKLNNSVDIADLELQESNLERALLLDVAPLPGVSEYLAEASRLEIKLGISSSASADWVTSNLKRLELMHYFEAITTQEEVQFTKPYPYLYEKTLKKLDLYPYQVIAIEDSPFGVTAAKAAGIFVVAVPNEVTRFMKLDHADMILNSLADVTLPELITRIMAG